VFSLFSRFPLLFNGKERGIKDFSVCGGKVYASNPNTTGNGKAIA
jgi:hypothetical protein